MTEIQTDPLNSSEYFTVAFYNLENLFDTVDDPKTYDNDFLPNADRRWTPRRYKKKLRKLGYSISKVGYESSKKLPVMVGLAEVENKQVVEDLLASKFLKKENYDVVHYDSPDERGIDTALIYNKDYFEVLDSEVFSVQLFDEDGSPDYTRDVLLVSGNLNNEKIYVLVNHWSSRREGPEITEPKRLKSSHKVSEIINDLNTKDANAKILILGDFNDDPNSKSVSRLVNEHDLYNPMETLMSFSRGSLNHQLHWNLFDQILFTTNFFESQSGHHSFSKADIFDDEFLKQFKGKYKGSPFRTYVGRKYKGGYSDHFPVYVLLKLL